MKLVKGLENKTDEDLLRKMEQFSLKKRSNLKGSCSEVCITLFSKVTSNMTQGNSLKFCQGKFRLDMRQIFFSLNVKIGIGTGSPR